MKRALLPLLLATATIPLAVQAQDDPPEVIVITLRPAGEPVPALKYRLLPEPRELVPGNAAIFYHRAIGMVYQRRIGQLRQAIAETSDQSKPSEEDFHNWLRVPLDQIPREKAREYLDRYQDVFREIDLAVRRRDCDWEFESRPETIELRMDEIFDGMRDLARRISLRVRLAILDGRTDEALHWLQNGYTMSRHVNQASNLIASLVGTALASLMNDGLLELIQEPGTPSLYWAIAASPRPFVDFTPAFESERTLMERYLPSLHDLDGPPWSVERGRQFTGEFLEKLSGLGQGPNMLTTLGLPLLVAKAYPEAKQALIAEGRPAEVVEAMPAVQVVALRAVQQYQQVRDDVFKWASLPYWQSHGRSAEAFQKYEATAYRENPVMAMLMLLLPAFDSARMAEVRLDRQFAALQCIEAIRLHAANHDGALPANLDDLTDAPAPLDPATGKPFDYQVEGDTATLSAPLIPGGPDHPIYKINYQLQLEK